MFDSEGRLDYYIAMKITHRTIKREISEDEFLRLKKEEPFKTFRQDAKACNFGLIFNMSYKKFSSSVLETSWSLERITNFVKDKGLEKIVGEMKEKYPTAEAKLWSYYAVADFIKKQFFDTYKGLLDRVKRNEKLGKDVGYIRSHHGGIRRVPMLPLAVGERGWWRPDDNLKEMSNLVNITSNTSIQTDESSVIAQAIIKWYTTYSEYSKDNPLIGMVHDSADFLIEKENAIETLLKMKECFESEEEWQEGIALLVDITVSDLTKGHYYKKGWDLDDFLKMKNTK